MARFNVELDSRANKDIASIRDYISKERGTALADRFVKRIFDHLTSFEIAPFRGQKRDDIDAALRTIGWRKRVTIAFTVDETLSVVRIIAIAYRGRDIEAILRNRFT